MSLTLYLHPLSSYCMKALVGLYETGTPFEAAHVNPGDETGAAFRKLWPIGKFPLLKDGERLIPESSIILEYLAQHYPGNTQLLPADADSALRTRAADRFYDLYVHNRMQDIVADRLRPPNRKDPVGVEETKAKLGIALTLLEQDMANRTWAMGDDFTMADCAAAPALFYVDLISPLAASHKNMAAYLARLKQRPSFARALKEAEPFMQYFPKE